MNQEDYRAWRDEAQMALWDRYTYNQADIVLEWFDNIKTSAERELVGPEIMDCLQVIVANDKHFSLYNNLMMRMWLYAPYILAEGKENE